MVLGLFDHASFEEETLTLQPGDAILAFSDGVTEALNADGEEFSDDRLLASVGGHHGGAPQAVVDAVLADVRAFCGDATQSDDVTVLMVRYERNVVDSR
jgi:sigma-B regulation protein RsbU (phosphoserine phosphatase)